MPTLRIIVKEKQQRADCKYPISIRLTHKRKVVFISTGYYASRVQLSRNFELKDNLLLGVLLERIVVYDKIIANLGLEVQNYSTKELADYIVLKSKPNQGLDMNFIEIANEYANKAMDTGRKGSANNYRCAINALADCRVGRSTTIKDFTVKMLEEFSAFLRTRRTITRRNQLGRMTTIVSDPLSEVSVYNYIKDLRTLYNAVVNDLDEELMNEALIRHNPFRKFKISQPQVSSSERTIDIQDLRKILLGTLPSNATLRTILAYDMYRLSFCLIGMNSVDLWDLPAAAYSGGRITYNRMKTKSRRADGALLSVRVEPEVVDLINKYRAQSGDRLFVFSENYSTPQNFNRALNYGLSKVAELFDIEAKLLFYTARHTWATIARNECRISKDDIHLSLNHSDSKMGITDRYIKRSWSFVDEANRKVLDLVYAKDEII